jgi:hypothetical protein
MPLAWHFRHPGRVESQTSRRRRQAQHCFVLLSIALSSVKISTVSDVDSLIDGGISRVASRWAGAGSAGWERKKKRSLPFVLPFLATDRRDPSQELHSHRPQCPRQRQGVTEAYHLENLKVLHNGSANYTDYLAQRPAVAKDILRQDKRDDSLGLHNKLASPNDRPLREIPESKMASVMEEHRRPRRHPGPGSS